MTKDEKALADARCLDCVIDKYNNYFQDILGFGQHSEKKKRRKPHKGHYPFVPSRSSIRMIDSLREAKDHIQEKRKDPYSRVSFLDCGCGVGNIMLLAGMISGFDIIAGIEYDPATYKIAKKLVPHYKVIKGDLAYFRHYADYDILYYFEPISLPKKRKAFMKKLANNMKVGAVVISNGGSMHFAEHEKFERLPSLRSCYEKVKA